MLMFLKHGTVESLQDMIVKTLRVPVFDGTLDMLSVQPPPHSYHSHPQTCNCNPTQVVMEPGEEGRKSKINFKEYSIFSS